MDKEKMLVENTLKGDVESFSVLVQGYQQRLYNFLLKMTLSKEDAEEILQEVFVRAYNYLYKYDSQFSFQSWIYKIALNTFKSEYKRKKKRGAVDLYAEIPEVFHSTQASPEDLYESKERFLEIVAMVNGLKSEQKVAFILKYIQDFSYKEIGEIMGISPDAAKMKVQRARHTLGKEFSQMREKRWSS